MYKDGKMDQWWHWEMGSCCKAEETRIYNSLYLSFLLVRPPRSQSLLIMGWCSSIPEHRLWIPLDSIPIFKDSMFPVRDEFGSFLLPPSEIRPGALLSRTSCPSPLSFRPFSLLSVRNRVFSRPPPVSDPPHRPSPIVRPPASYQPSGSVRPMSSYGSPTQRPICRLAPPPNLYGWWYLAWVWVCVG